MNTKTRKKDKKIQYSSEKTIEFVQVSLAIPTKTSLNVLTRHSIGGGSLPNKTYGSGPLAYDGVTNNSNTVFSGTSRMDAGRHILVYNGQGVSMFSSANSNDSLSQHVDKARMSSCQIQVVIPVSAESMISNSVEGFRELRNSYTQGVKRPKIKVEIDERTQTLKIGSASRLVKISVQDVERSGNKSKGLVLQAQFRDSQASNLLEAAKLTPGRSLLIPVAASLLSALSNLPSSPFLDPFRETFSSFPVSDVFLSKRERTARVSNTKVMYARNGLSSIIKNIPVLDPTIASQYVTVVESFCKDLLVLAKRHGAAYDIASSLKKSLGSLPQSRPSSESIQPSTTSIEPVDDEGESG